MVVGCADALGNRELGTAILDLAAAVLLLAALWMNRRGWTRPATWVTLCTVTALVTGIMWAYHGVRDPAVLAYQAILVAAAMLGGTRLFLMLLVFMVANLGLLVGGSIQGWHARPLPPENPGTFLDLAAILVGTGFTVWLLARDLRGALARVEEENLRVQASQGHIEFLAHYDILTGLPNRTLGRDLMAQAVAQARRAGRGAALLHLDLDNFKTINDSMGHGVGDQLLVDASLRIQQALRAGDTLCRQGGDEFLAVLGDLGSGDEAAAAAVRIQSVLAAPFQVQGLELAVTASVGLALFPEDGADFETLLQRADTAMYQAKASGRNAFRFFDPAMNTSVLEHLQVASGLRAALERGEFVLHYQPQFDLGTGHMVGAEALIRWRHPEMGLIPPGTFIPVAEKSGQIVEIGRWALREACRQAARWREQGLQLVMAVNLSPVQFKRDDLELTLLNAMEDAGLPGSCLELELTESMLIEDSAALVKRLGDLKAMGVALSIDDFGTGYSNLSYLQRFEVERLKIDQSFVRRLRSGSQDEAIVRAIIQMAKSLNLGTVAEGIEDEPTLERVKALGCDLGQGFLWSKALPEEEFLAYARSRP